jgi:hypothetical protein
MENREPGIRNPEPANAPGASQRLPVDRFSIPGSRFPVLNFSSHP